MIVSVSLRSSELVIVDIDSSGGSGLIAIGRFIMVGPTMSHSCFPDWVETTGSFDPRWVRRYTVARRTAGERERGSGYHTNSNARFVGDNSVGGMQSANNFGWIDWCLNSSSSICCTCGG